MKNVVLNYKNIVPNSGNTVLRYTFPTTVDFKEEQIAVANITIPISWNNITIANNNNKYQYVWYDAGGATTHDVIMPDGGYDVQAFNAFLQFTMINNGHYLIDGSGNYVYYLQVATNTVYYGIDLQSAPIPTALPAGYSNPAGLTFPAVATTPQFVIPNTNITKYLGFPAGTYPNPVQATPYSITSPNVPDVPIITNIITFCSLVNNKFQYPNNVLYSFVPGGNIGEIVNAKPFQYVWVDIQDGYYNSFDISFVDQKFNKIVMKDENVFVQLIFKKKTEVSLLRNI